MNAQRHISFLAVPRRTRRAFLMSELIVACAVAVVAMVGIAQLMFVVTRHYRFEERRSVIAQEAANVMEDLMSRPWTEITGESAPAVELSDACRQVAPDAQVKLDIATVKGQRQARRITVRIQWMAHGDQAAEPIQLVAWRYKDQ